MRIGPMRHRLAIQRAVETRDSQGGITKTWTTLATRWGSVEPLSGREAVIAMQTDARVTHRVRMRYYSGLEPTDRIVHNSRNLGIVEVKNLREIGAQHELLCVEAV